MTSNNYQSNNKYKVYTYTESYGKTEIMTEIKCKYNGKDLTIEVKVNN